MPIVMGEASREVYRIEGDLAKNEKVFLLRLVRTRSVIQRDERQIKKLMETYKLQAPPLRIIELEVINDNNKASVDPHHAALIHGYITNLLPGAFKAPELNDWFILEKPAELTSLKMARFAINLLDDDSRQQLLGLLVNRNRTDANKYAQYR